MYTEAPLLPSSFIRHRHRELFEVLAHDRRMQPPAQPRLVARLALAARIELGLELGHLRVIDVCARSAPEKNEGMRKSLMRSRP